MLRASENINIKLDHITFDNRQLIINKDKRRRCIPLKIIVIQENKIHIEKKVNILMKLSTYY